MNKKYHSRTKIGIIADTHIPVSASAIPSKVIQYFLGVDLILHAGDLVDLAVLEQLKKIASTEAVYGNMDRPEVRQALPKKKIIQVGRFKIGLIHGSGSPSGLITRVKKEFDREILHIIIFGHSHSPCEQILNDVLFFNPGSPTDHVFVSLNTFGLLKITDKITPKIIKI